MHSDLCKAADQLQICTAVCPKVRTIYTLYYILVSSIKFYNFATDFDPITFEVRVSFCQKCKTRAAVHPLHSDHSLVVSYHEN